MEKPTYYTEEHARYLNALRKIGAYNMFGASLPLRQAFPELNKEQARKVVAYWMETFNEGDEK